MSREAYRVTSIKDLSADFHRRFTMWFVLGVPAFIIVVAIFFFFT